MQRRGGEGGPPQPAKEARHIRTKTMQSDRNSFCGGVVSNSFYKTSQDEDNILEQLYKSKYVRIIVMMILILYTKMHNNTIHIW